MSSSLKKIILIYTGSRWGFWDNVSLETNECLWILISLSVISNSVPVLVVDSNWDLKVNAYVKNKGLYHVMHDSDIRSHVITILFSNLLHIWLQLNAHDRFVMFKFWHMYLQSRYRIFSSPQNILSCPFAANFFFTPGKLWYDFCHYKLSFAVSKILYTWCVTVSAFCFQHRRFLHSA